MDQNSTDRLRIECPERALEFGHFEKLSQPAQPRELSFLGIEHGSRGPKGQESLAQGLPWVFVLSREALKGHPL
jgi:hypothetical protein